MKPEDIIVGRQYKHEDYPGCVWLGIGKRKPFTGMYGAPKEFTEKYLVMLSGIDPGVGLIFKTEEDEEGCWPDDWAKFSLVAELK